MIKVTFFILNYNGSKLLPECINSFLPVLDNKSEIILIDNGSKDDSITVMKKYNLKIVEIKNNNGFPGGFNKGIKMANSNSDWYCLVSNDVINLNKNMLKRFRKDVKKIKNIGIMGCYFILPNKKMQGSGGNLKLSGLTQSPIKSYNSTEKITHLDFVNGALFFIKKDVWKKANGFDMIFYPYFSEEVDLEMRVRKMNYVIVKNKNLQFLHKHNATIKNETTKASKIVKRNNAILKLIHYPFHWILISFILEFKSFFNIFLIKENNKIKFAKNIPLRFITLFAAYFNLIKKIPEVINSRKKLLKHPYK